MAKIDAGYTDYLTETHRMLLSVYRRFLTDDLAVQKLDDPLAETGAYVRVGNHQDGGSLVIQINQQLHHPRDHVVSSRTGLAVVRAGGWTER